eukprot:g34613.t1
MEGKVGRKLGKNRIRECRSDALRARHQTLTDGTKKGEDKGHSEISKTILKEGTATIFKIEQDSAGNLYQTCSGTVDRFGSKEDAPVCINGPVVEMVESVKFLGVRITNDLSWSTRIDATVKKTQQRLYFHRKLRKFGRSIRTLLIFIDASHKAFYLDAPRLGYGNCSAQGREKLQRVGNTAQSIRQTILPSMDS